MRKLYLPDRYPVICGEGRGIGLCTAWVDPEILLKSTPALKESAALIGTLYSLEGINIILRNLLLNPDIRILVLWANTPLSRTSFGQKGWRALKALFTEGVSKAQELGFKPHPQFSLGLLQEIISYVAFLDLSSLSPKELSLEMQKLSPKAPERDPLELEPFVPAVSQVFPSEKIGFTVREKGALEAWKEGIYYILRFGTQISSSETRSTRELLGLSFIIEEPQRPFSLKDIPLEIREKIALNSESLKEYSEIFINKDKKEGTSYTYGERVRSFSGKDQLEEVIKKLQSSSFSRRALVTTWFPEKDLTNPLPPCFVFSQFFVREEKVYMLSFFRSQDVFKAFLPNFFGLRTLHSLVAEKLGKEPGPLEIVVGSAHIYEEDLEDAKRFLECQRKLRPFDPEKDLDPRGSLIIKTEGEEIIVWHTSEGSVLEEIRFRIGERKLSEFLRELYFKGLFSRIDHALDIGEQLGKAELSLKKGFSFEQDKT